MGKYLETKLRNKDFKKNYTPKNNLPAELTEFIGRKNEIDAINNLLRTARLITLWGPGGIGKSRLSLKVASSNLRNFKDGVYFISLASITQPDLVVSNIAKALNIVEIPGQQMFDTLKTALRDKRRLLILDNFEQVVEAAMIVSELLYSAPNLSIIVTSREPLRISGEHLFNVPPLEIPDSSKKVPIEELKEQPSIALFLSRAKAIRYDFSLTEKNAEEIKELCAVLEGIPLAIELAAAYLGQTPVPEMLKLSKNRLDWLTNGPRDLPKRQQTLKNTIEWGYDLLDETLQKLFMRLGVFKGKFDLEAVESIVNYDHTISGNMWENMMTLINKSILKMEPCLENDIDKYFDMLETIREYAVELLSGSEDEKSVKEKHSDFYLNLVVKAEGNINGPDRQLWLNRLEYARPNLFSALEYMQSINNTENELIMAGILGQFWEARGYWNEGIYRLGLIVNKYRHKIASQNLVTVYKWYGRLLDLHGNHNEAISILKEGLEIAKSISDRWGEAGILYNLALAEGTNEEILFKKSLYIYREIGVKSGIAAVLQDLSQVLYYKADFNTAELYCAESLEISRQLGDKKSEARALGKMGLVARGKGDYKLSIQMFTEYLFFCEELDDKEGIANALLSLAELARARGNYELSEEYYLKTLNIGNELGYKYIVARTMKDLGEIYRYKGNFNKANELFNESISILRENGDFHGEIPWLYRNMAEVRMQLKNYLEAEELYLKGLELYEECKLNTFIYVLLVFQGLASIASEMDQLERAGRLFGAALRLLEMTSNIISKGDMAEYEKRIAEFRSKVDDITFERLINEGRMISLECALDLALERKNKSDSKMADKMIKYIHENYYKDISLYDISEYFRLSHGYISTLFKYYTGENFKDYLNSYRVKKAKEIFKDTHLKVNEVADMVGCNHINTFIRIFKKYEGMSPSQYLLKMRDDGSL